MRMAGNAKYRNTDLVKPEMEWLADGTVMLTMCIPTNRRTAEAVAVQIAKKFGLVDPEVISREVMQEAEGTRIELKGKVDFGYRPFPTW